VLITTWRSADMKEKGDEEKPPARCKRKLEIRNIMKIKRNGMNTWVQFMHEMNQLLERIWAKY